MSLRKFSLNSRLKVALAALIASMTLSTMNAFSQSGSPLADDHPDTYTVVAGDTLWDIADTFLKDPWYWPEIWYINPQVENPHLIYPGDVLGLVYVEGQPRVGVVTASTLRLSPEARVTPLTEAITSVSYDSISAFLSTGMVIEKDQADSLPYILATRGDHLVAAAGNTVYVRRMSNDTPGQRYNVVKIGDELIDPDNDDVIGYQGVLVGAGTIRRSGDPATMALTESNREAKQGDVLVPMDVEVPLNFYPKAPSREIGGQIISVVDGVTQIGQYQVVVMNRGSADGLSVGDVLTVFQQGAEVRDHVEGGLVRLPEESAGTVMVFKSFDDISYGLVMEATEAIHIHDFVRNPI